MVPEGWVRSDLSAYIQIKHGYAFKSQFFAGRGKFILLTPGSFNESGGFRDQGNKTKYYVGEIPDGYLLRKNDLLIAMTEQAEGLLGSPLFVPEGGKYLHNQRLGLVKIERTDQICPEFVYLFYNEPAVRRQITEQSTGTKVKHTSPDRLRSVVGLIPPILEQQKIAKILSTWDEAIATTEQLLANSEQQKKALMQQLLTGKKRLPGFEGEWQRMRIGDFLMENRESSSNPDPSRRLTVKLNMKGVEKREVRGTESRDSTAHFVRRAGQFIYGKQNIHKGAFGVVPKEFDGFETSQDLPAFDFTGRCDPDWFIFFFSRHDFYKTLENRMSGTGSKRLKPSALYKVPVLAPHLEEQQEIGKVLTAAKNQVTVLSKLCASLKQEKKALMQQLLTGKRRVKIDEAEQATA